MSVQVDTEAEKMRRIPGIIFTDGPTGRRARIAGTGIDVFELIAGYLSVDEDWDSLTHAYHWLSEDQLRAALAYYAAYPEEIEERLARQDYWTPERIWEAYPFTRPRPKP